MSQQINLLNPALRPSRDPLTLDALLLVSGAALLLIVGLYLYERADRAAQATSLAAATEQSTRLQEELKTLGRMLTERQPDPGLTREIDETAVRLRQREEVLKVLDSAAPESSPGFSRYFLAFARQTIDGLWLTGFSLSGERMEIRGRMMDAALLPTYVRRLEGEQNFHGRRFAALDMKSVQPPTQTGAQTATEGKKSPSYPYVEFTLQGVQGMESR